MTNFFENVLIVAQIAIEDLNTLPDKGLSLLLEGMTHENPGIREAIILNLEHSQAYQDREHKPQFFKQMAQVILMDERPALRVPILEAWYAFGTRNGGTYEYLIDAVKVALEAEHKAVRVAALKAVQGCHIDSLQDQLLMILDREPDDKTRAYIAFILSLRHPDTRERLRQRKDIMELFAIGVQDNTHYWNDLAGRFLHTFEDEDEGLALIDILNEHVEDRVLKRRFTQKLEKISETANPRSGFMRIYQERYGRDGNVFVAAGLDIDAGEGSWANVKKALHSGKAKFYPIGNALYMQSRRKLMESLYDEVWSGAEDDDIRQSIERDYERVHSLIKRMES